MVQSTIHMYMLLSDRLLPPPREPESTFALACPASEVVGQELRGWGCRRGGGAVGWFVRRVVVLGEEVDADDCADCDHPHADGEGRLFPVAHRVPESVR